MLFCRKKGDTMTTIICDGNNLVYRCASVMQLTTKSGFPTGGIYGTLNALSSYLRDLPKLLNKQVCECIVVFDGGRSQRRTTMYPEYKGGRKTDADRTEEEREFYHNFLKQTEILIENLPNFGIKVIQVKGWEADDVIYGITKQAEVLRDDEENNYVIVSTDEDFLQLVSPTTSVYSPVKQIYYDYYNFENLFGCKPENFISYKILKGDSSDNISGIQGIGEKTGKKLVNEYNGLIGILHPSNRELLMKSKVTQRIFTEDGLRTIDRNNKLINIKEFVDYQDIEDDLYSTITEQPSVDEKSARAFLMKYQLSSILVKFKDWIKPYKDLVERYYES